MGWLPQAQQINFVDIRWCYHLERKTSYLHAVHALSEAFSPSIDPSFTCQTHLSNSGSIKMRLFCHHSAFPVMICATRLISVCTRGLLKTSTCIARRFFTPTRPLYGTQVNATLLPYSLISCSLQEYHPHVHITNPNGTIYLMQNDTILLSRYLTHISTDQASR